MNAKRYIGTFLGIVLLVLMVGCSKSTLNNLGFELGDFTGWESDTESFTLSNEITFAPNRYYMQDGTFHVVGSISLTGTLVSTPIPLDTTGFVSFLLSGAANEDTYIGIYDASTNDEIIKVHNDFYDEPDFTFSYLRVNLDLSDYVGRKILIKVVDASTTASINVDDFRIDCDETLFTELQIETNIRLGLDNYDDMLKAANTYTKLNAWKVGEADRFRFHVTGQIGWINDPNGFAFFQNKIHLFYQHNPYQTVWGPMHWGHVVSDDFIKWEYVDVALAPDKEYDAVGAFSGSAIEFGGKYYLVYTGASEGVQVQAIAVSTDGIHYTKYANNPVIGTSMLPANSSVADFRDPKVWEKDGTVYMIVSSRNATNQYSKLLLYKTTNMIDWTYAGKLLGNGSNLQNKLGIMFECPDYFELGGRGIITVSPQTVFGHQNADSNVYIVGDLNYQTGTFENWNFDDIAQIDYGFDFYAPQSMLMPDGRRVLVAWMASWNRRPIYYGTGIAGAITLPREVWLVGNKLYQLPVAELQNYYQNEVVQDYQINNSSYQYQSELNGWYQDISLTFDPLAGKTGITVFDDGQGNGMKIYYENGRVYVDRYGVTDGYYAATDFHNITSVDALLVDGKVKIRIVLDRYSAEIFVSDGYKAMTVTGFPKANQTQTALFSDFPNGISVTKHDIILE